MARTQQVIVTLEDDVDGSVADETITFALDGTTYEIDLNKKNAKALRADFDKWVGYGRKARKATTTRRRGGASAGSEAATIRAWAHENGVDVPARGRIPAAVVEQYRAS